MPYHLRITPRSNRSRDIVKLDLTREQLEDHFLKPYREGRPISIGGKSFFPSEIERIRINFTEEPSEQLLLSVRKEEESCGIIGPISDEWYVADRGKDVTDEFVIGTPETSTTGGGPIPIPRFRGPRVVFVVHGRNRKARDAMFFFLRSIGLYPLEWSEAVQATGKTSPYVGEILDSAFSIAQAIVVLMTPDDEARLRKDFISSEDPHHETELTPQARPNVIFEAGMALGRFPHRTILVELGLLRPFSDIGGRHVVRLNDSIQMRMELAKRLQAAGCPLNLTGTEWQRAGSFDEALK